MFATALIVFRETLEAALFVGIIAAATRGVSHRNAWLAGGVSLGVLSSLIVALAMERISELGGGLGQDLFNIIVIVVALLMLAWHCIWVSTHSREIANAAKQLGQSVAENSGSMWALFIAVALAVLREGAETVIFVSGFLTGNNTENHWLTLAEVGMGLFSGAFLGVLIYSGLSRIKTKYFFYVTNTWILIMAGALAARLAQLLAQSGIFDYWSQPLWDTSSIVSMDSFVGMLLKALIGYDAQPSALGIMFYVGMITLILAGAKQVQKLKK